MTGQTDLPPFYMTADIYLNQDAPLDVANGINQRIQEYCFDFSNLIDLRSNCAALLL